MLQHHAKKFIDEFTLAEETILNSTYMDDSMDSVLDEEAELELHRPLSRLLSKMVCTRGSGCRTRWSAKRDPNKGPQSRS